MSSTQPPADAKSMATTFDIKDYRQPLVTSLGVILGFLIGFLAQWISEDDFELHGVSDGLVFVGCIVGAGLLLSVLFRMLTPSPTDVDQQVRYRAILRQYIVGVSIAFLSLIAAAFF
jgi:Na+/serine symporter